MIYSNKLSETDLKKLQTSATESYTEQWLDNSNFSTQESWFPLKKGDDSDVSTNINNSQGNLLVLGEERTFSEISGTPIFSEWEKVHNTEFPAYPITATINTEGCYVFHEWPENAYQTPSVHWDRNITMPVDMSDYIITSASISAVLNATVTAYPGGASSDPSGWGVETPGDETGPTQGDNDQFYTGDYVRFYVLLSDLDKNKVYEVAYNQTVDLGKDSAGSTDNMTDTDMTYVSEEDLKFFLTSVLSSDYRNFTITLGIRIWCEDNWWSDRDRWDSLLIKSCSLNFTYQKKTDRFTTVSWNQIGDEITGKYTHIKNASLNFKYKVDQNWPEISPNSEIKILINNNSYRESKKLSAASTSFRLFNPTGIDVTYLIQKDVNISVSVEVSLADTFPLDRDITISIDDVSLEISLIITDPIDVFAPWIFTALLVIAIIAIVSIGSYLFAYHRVLKYPIPVRKVRRYRKSLKMQKEPALNIISRKQLFEKSYNKELSESSKLVKTGRIGLKEKLTGVSVEPLRQTEKLGTKMTSDDLIDKSIEKKTELDKLVDELDNK